jgi:Flp pilus assembly secretin CpaC
MKPSNVVALAAMIGCVVLLALLIQSRNELAVANAALASLRSANADISARIADLESKRLDQATLNRLQNEQREAIKLRGEVSTLKKSLATAETQAAASAALRNFAKSEAKPGLGATDDTTNAYARILTRKINASMGLGHGLLFGGWQTQPGKQTFAVAVPNIDPANPQTVDLQTKLFEVSEEALGKLDTTMLARAAGQQATMTPEKVATFLTSLESTPGVSVLSSPRMVVFSGQQGRVFVGNHIVTPDGPMELGSSIEYTPTLGADGESVELAVNAKLTLPNETAVKP